MIINGDLPGRFVWQDDTCVAFLSIGPLAPAHTLVVPRAEIDLWTDADPALLSHCTTVAQTIGQALVAEWDAPRAGLIIAGFEVPHLHVHVFPAWGLEGFDFHNADTSADPAELDANAGRLRARLRAQGHGGFVPA